jgi:hypothetical protein
MNSTELFAQICRDMGILADSEPMMKRVAKYLRKLVAEKAGKSYGINTFR